MVTPDDRHVIAANRGHNSLAVFDRSKDGKLKLNSHYLTGGSHPRNFDISKDGKVVIVANQDSDRLNSFVRDPVSGRLECSALTMTETPAFVKLFDLNDYPWAK